MGIFDFMQEEIAIDLGTANTLIIHNDKVVVDEPSIVAKDIRTGEVVAIGKRAQQMHGKTHKKIDLILNLWANYLISSDLNISSLGSFKINQKNSRLGRNPKTKEEHIIKSRKAISFKKSKNLEI